MTNAKDTAEKSRKKRNQELLEKMENGESLLAYTPEQSFFPERGIIKKDKKAIKKLYQGDKDEENKDTEEKNKGD